MGKKVGFVNRLDIKKLVIITALSVVILILLCAAGQMFLRNFYHLLAFDEQFCAIFEQISLQNVKMASPVLILGLLELITVVVICLLWRKNAVFKVLAILFGVVIFFILFVVSVLFTRVNGVTFLDVVLSLVPLLSSGAL